MIDTLIEIDEQERVRLETLLIYEEEAYAKGYEVVAGIDEAGRGPLAGPVVAAICLLPRKLLVPHVNDSKKLTAQMRERLFEQLTSDPSIQWAVGIVEALEIDQINIYQATILAMTKAIQQMATRPDYLLVDGMPLHCSHAVCQKMIKGDQLSQSIAAASIIAKETRDRLMRVYHTRWPMYGFAQHKGYGTAKHVAALKEYGPCDIHRRSFDPLRSSLA